MQAVIVKLLASLDLSRTEREVARRFGLDPEGRAFLPVADILRAHGHQNEAIEILLEGVERHPSFTVARVVLARELLQKGLVVEARRALEESSSSLRDNILAQKLFFKIHTLIGDESSARDVLEHLKVNRLIDAETRRYGELMDLQGFATARQRMLKDMSESGIDVQVPEFEGGAPSVGDKVPANAEFRIIGDEETSVRDQDAVAGFHTVPLKDIFQSGDGDPGRVGAELRKSGLGGPSLGVELDSGTLADIYARQGHYGKALAIFRRMLRMSPQNELLRRKVAEIQELERKQRDIDVDVDTGVADRVETLEVIEAQIRFYQDMLNALGSL